MLYTRIVLGLGVLMFAGLGIVLMFLPGKLESWVGIAAQNPQAKTELRAWYGGAELGLALFLLYGMFRADAAPHAMLLLALMSAGPLLGRLIGMLSDQSANGTMWGFAAFEVTFTVLGLIGWSRGVPE